MTTINPRTLRKLRERHHLTLDELAERAKVDRGTISKIETGKRPACRPTTLRKLADALAVEADILLGADIDDAGPASIFARKSQLNFKMADDARNALNLVAMRYDVKAAHILHLAPFLFFWAAEESLRWRQAKVDAITAQLDALSRTDTPKHLNALATNNWRGEEVLEEERRSIAKRDLFGLLLSDDAVSFDYEESEWNPMVQFLASLAEPLDGVMFEHWSPYWSHPGYTLGEEEALGLTGGDADAAQHILNGNAPLHEMPREIREGGPEQVARWASELGDKFLEKLEQLDLLGCDQGATDE